MIRKNESITVISENSYVIRKRIRSIISLGIFLIVALTACKMLQSQSDLGGVSDTGAAAGVTIVYPSEDAKLQVGEFVDVNSRIGDPLGSLLPV